MTTSCLHELVRLSGLSIALIFLSAMFLLVCYQWNACQQHCRELEAQIARDKQDWKNLFVSPKTP